MDITCDFSAHRCTNIVRLLIVFLFIASSNFIHAEEKDKAGEDNFITALTGGKVHFSARYRFENVDDDARLGGSSLKDADASTIRTSLGYETGLFYGFGARLDLENVTEVGSDDFNDGSNGKTQFATIIDPSGTEVDQAYLSFAGIPDTILKGGRQYITYRKAPFHRYIGTILWRQNWQTFDAFSVENKLLPDTTISYAYVWNVNRIFGEDATSPLDNFDSDSHFINIKYNKIPYANLEGYAYLLDFDNAAGFSTDTFGVRLTGAYPLTEKVKAIYTAEYADQSHAGNNTADIDASYFLGELGGSVKLNNIVELLTLKFSYELLEGEGGADRFVTILGTNHAYQGWADRFLITPGDGIEDYYVTAVAKIWGAKFIASYHDINSDNLHYDFGNELDLLLTKTFEKYYTFGIKYSIYDADQNTTNIVQNGAGSGVANDVNKFWVWAQIKF